MLAALVIYGHVFPLGGLEPIRVGPFLHAGLHGNAVEGFFAVSGYLILASGMRTSLLAYLWRRFLRIYPGYLVAIVVTAFVAAPLGARLEPGAVWHAQSATQYVLGALDLRPSQDGVDSTLLHVPWPVAWNGSLWTLFFEAAAYLGIAMLCAWGPVRRRAGIIVPPGAAALAAVYILLPEETVRAAVPGTIGSILSAGIRLWAFFACGMLAYLLADRIRPTRRVGVLALAVFLLAVHLVGLPPELSRVLTLISLPVAVLFAGALLPVRIGSRNDLSYGVYVYAFPVQQLLVLLGAARLGWFAAATACFLLTLPLAWLSWTLIERPALQLKSFVRSRRRTQGGGAAHRGV